MDCYEGTASGTLEATEQTSNGGAENPISGYAPPGSLLRSDEGKALDCGDMLTVVHKQTAIVDTTMACNDGLIDPLDAAEYIRLAARVANHDPVVGGFHEMMNLQDAENHSSIDTERHNIEAGYTHSTHSNLKDVGKNHQGKVQLNRRTTAAKWKMLVRLFSSSPAPTTPKTPGMSTGSSWSQLGPVKRKCQGLSVAAPSSR